MKNSRKTLAVPMGILWSLLAALATTMLGCMLTAFLISGEKVEATAVGYGAMLTVLLASVLGAVVIVLTVKEKRFVMCLAAGGLYYLCLLCMTALFFEGQYQGLGATALLVLGGSAGVAILSLRGSRGTKKHRVRYKIR